MKNSVFQHVYSIVENLRISMCSSLCSVKIDTWSWASHLTFWPPIFSYSHIELCVVSQTCNFIFVGQIKGVGRGGENGKTKQGRKDKVHFRRQLSGCLGLGLGAGIDGKKKSFEGAESVLTLDCSGHSQIIHLSNSVSCV